MAYVDLNPVCAGMAKTPERSTFTSVRKRIKQEMASNSPAHIQQHHALMPFAGNPWKNMPDGLLFRLDDYLHLVDGTDRIVREDKRGAIPDSPPPIVERLNTDAKQWCYLAQNFGSPFTSIVGSVHKLRQVREKLNYVRPPGPRSCEMYFI